MPGRDKTGPIAQGRGLGRANVTRGQGFGRGLGRGLGNRVNIQNANTDCVCPNCGHEQKHIRGQPCNKIECPKCKTLMTRK